jgi:hypothetical protein
VIQKEQRKKRGSRNNYFVNDKIKAMCEEVKGDE